MASAFGASYSARVESRLPMGATSTLPRGSASLRTILRLHMAKQTPTARSADQAPDQRALTDRQAMRLATLSGVDAKEIAGTTIAQISDRFKWKIDPTLLFFRRVCGRVVKKDPITGIEYPVPFATVTVEDTDCNLLAYFPHGWPWGWYYP